MSVHSPAFTIIAIISIALAGCADTARESGAHTRMGQDSAEEAAVPSAVILDPASSDAQLVEALARARADDIDLSEIFAKVVKDQRFSAVHKERCLLECLFTNVHPEASVQGLFDRGILMRSWFSDSSVIAIHAVSLPPSGFDFEKTHYAFSINPPFVRGAIHLALTYQSDARFSQGVIEAIQRGEKIPDEARVMRFAICPADEDLRDPNFSLRYLVE